MKVDFEKYYKIYHQEDGKFLDILQSEKGLKTVPFVSNTQAKFDKYCGLLGTTGEFFRKWKDTETRPIKDFKTDVEEPVSTYMRDYKHMSKSQIFQFIDMLRDILYVNGNLNITDSSFLKYLPLMPYDERLSDKEAKKYKSGQQRLADYLYSMTDGFVGTVESKSTPNLFTTILKDALEIGARLRTFDDIESSGNYYANSYIKESFRNDISWLLEQEESVIVKNVPLLLHFYACYSVVQTIIGFSPKKRTMTQKPEPLYYILSSEKASLTCEAVTRGWMQKVPKEVLERLYGKIQAIEIANCCLGGHVGLYPELLVALQETPFADNKEACEKILDNYQTDKRKHLLGRQSESNKGSEPIDTTISSYEEFLEKLHYLCTDLQSASYSTRMRKNVLDLFGVRFLKLRRGNYVLELDNEMLIFLIAMVTKGKKTKLEEMYKSFNEYGIHFNIGTRTAIEELLIKLNLLDRKSDSGEAQYVTVIL